MLTLANPELMEIVSPVGEVAIGGSQQWYPGRRERMSGCGPTAASNLVWYMARSRGEPLLLEGLRPCGDAPPHRDAGDGGVDAPPHRDANGGEKRPLCKTAGDKAGFVALMAEMFSYVTPGLGGVNSPDSFSGGVARYGASRGVALTPHVLRIPRRRALRPGIGAVLEFVTTALHADSPVAFLNLSNGALQYPESWHWVTIIGLETGANGSGAEPGAAESAAQGAERGAAGGAAHGAERGAAGGAAESTAGGAAQSAAMACISDQGRTLDICLADWLDTTMLGGAMVYITA